MRISFAVSVRPSSNTSLIIKLDIHIVLQVSLSINNLGTIDDDIKKKKKSRNRMHFEWQNIYWFDQYLLHTKTSVPPKCRESPFHITCPLGREFFGKVDSPNKELILWNFITVVFSFKSQHNVNIYLPGCWFYLIKKLFTIKFMLQHVPCHSKTDPRGWIWRRPGFYLEQILPALQCLINWENKRCLLSPYSIFHRCKFPQWFKFFTHGKVVLSASAHCLCGLGNKVAFFVRRAGLLWSQQDFEWLWSVPFFKCLTVLEFSFILFDLCLLITFFNSIMNYVPIVTFWIFTYHKIWILSIMFCFIWSYWIIYFLACLEVSWRVVS